MKMRVQKGGSSVGKTEAKVGVFRATAAACLAVFAGLGLSGCFSDQDYQPLSLQPVQGQFIAQGVIDSSTPKVIEAALKAHPEIKTLVLTYVPGSVDDHANLEASRLLKQNGITTLVPQGGLVASGGTDMFLAGVTREIGAGACIGVHSWAAGGLGGMTQGKDVPRDDPQHQLYLSYYAEIGIDPDFYWFTLEAADANNIHYMSNTELARFSISTIPLTGHEEASAASCAAIEAAQDYS